MKLHNIAASAAVACLLFAGSLQAQSQGPDIVVHQLGVDGNDTNDIHYWGTSGGIRAYSLATQSCNIGNQTVLWQSNNTNHPVIGQSMYRLKDGRFEQIGQSWLKHGFCAVSEPGCGSCQSTPCSTLGIGCADTYWATLNDGSSGGPKHEISPTSGQIQYPYSSPSGPSAIRGRLQVYEEDIDPNQNAGAVYFGSSLYISEHDHSFGNAANNSSWRKLDVVSITNIDGDGPTNVGMAPPYAWRAEENSVVVTKVTNLNEAGAGINGYYFVGHNVVDNGDGTYSYHYAVYNLNSEQGCGDFSIPVTSNAQLTDVYFNDVEYHSGELQDNTNWTHSISGGEIKWECTETYAQNPNGNAIRWGTTYSFGFTTASAPQDVTATMGMYEPGVSSALTVPVKGPGTPPPLFINFPSGRPDTIDPSGGTSLVVNTSPGTDTAVASSGVLHVEDAGQWTQVSMTDTAPGVHEVSFPAVTCGATIDWYVSFDLSAGGTHSAPAGAPSDTYDSEAILLVTIAEDDLESDSGWVAGDASDSATTGQWTRVDPLGTAAQPEDDHTTSGSLCFVTGQGSSGGSLGENDVDGGTTTLYSPVYDLSSSTDPAVSYWRWYSNDQGASPNADTFVVQISNDGGSSWSDVEVVGPSGPGTSGGWNQHSFQVSDIVAPTATVQLRFLASDLGSGSIVEAAIDDLEITDTSCGGGSAGPGLAYCSGDGSGTACPCGNAGGAGEGEGCPRGGAAPAGPVGDRGASQASGY
ncbi:MAG: hypothetical protein MK291_01550 [Planctomycetes bacterium]|nr:hypothetical protein [Planctomycetota bacterium]